MKFSDWLRTVPCEITNDPIWKLEVYQLAPFAAAIGWQDVASLSRKAVTRGTADQLYRSLGSISSNLTEGFSRSKGPERAHYFEISLGSARESRDWYYKVRRALPIQVVQHRIELLTHIIGMLTTLIPHQRAYAIREEQTEYKAKIISFGKEIPVSK